MSDQAALPEWRGGWLNRLIARPGFQRWAAAMPLVRRQARADGAALFDIVQGFVASQALVALVELDIFKRLRGGPKSAADLGQACDVAEPKMQVLLQSGAALGLLKRKRGGRYGLARKGAALLGVPGLEAMIRHHRAFYDDLKDPVALLRGDIAPTQLAEFWPYVFGARGDVDPDVAETYSDLMAQSQTLVAQDTLRAVSFKDVHHLMDVGGGTGAFLAAAGAANQTIEMTLFDLPEVAPGAATRFERAGMRERVTIASGSFRDDVLPIGADAISLVRVLYDHDDQTGAALLAKVFAALPEGGRLIVSEPMAGGVRPERAGDVYFAFYTMAMMTGRARSAEEIAALCAEAGFEKISSPTPARPFVTRVLTARKPAI